MTTCALSLRWVLNPGAAMQTRLKISSKVLALAKIIQVGPDP